MITTKLYMNIGRSTKFKPTITNATKQRSINLHNKHYENTHLKLIINEHCMKLR